MLEYKNKIIKIKRKKKLIRKKKYIIIIIILKLLLRDKIEYIYIYIVYNK